MNPLGTTTEMPRRAQSKETAAVRSDLAGSATRAQDLLKVGLGVGLCALMAFGPLALGAVDQWTLCVLELAAAALWFLWAMEQLVSTELKLVPNVLFTPIVLFGALVVAQLLLNRTAYWYVSWQKALLWAALGIVFFLTTQCFGEAVGRRNIGLFFSIYGFLMSVFAVIQHFTSNDKIYWVIPNHGGGWVSGPYVNHAHYAGLMEMLVPFPLVFAMTYYWQKPVRILFGFAALIMASTIFLSQSRGGIFAFIGEMAFFALLLTRERFSRSALTGLAMLGVFLAVWLTVLRPVGLEDRLVSLKNRNDAAIRVAILKDSLRMVRERPLLGWGLGTFTTVYPSFRSFPSNLEINETHNDFVQLLIETGIAGFALMVIFLIFLYRSGMQHIEYWRRKPARGITVAALTGCTGLLLHSWTDFNLQIPANAVLFFVLTAIATCDQTAGKQLHAEEAPDRAAMFAPA